MVWDFKRSLYCADHKISIKYCQDLNDPRIRAKLQAHFDSTGRFPRDGTTDEYAFYFETVYPDEADRRRYIDQVANGKPSYGHLVLATLLKLDKIRIVWTTNFDRMLEDAAMSLLGSSGKLVTVNLDNASMAMEAVNESRWPILIKLHGDFQSRRLKNTSEELRKQDAQLSHALTESCKRYGLAVVGYSGRDDSVMESIEKVIDGGRGFPAGLFWFHRSDSKPSDRVSNLIAQASAQGIDAHLIEAETFDELMSDLLLLQQGITKEMEEYLNKQPRRVSDIPIAPVVGGWPILRLNALRILSWPASCRKVVCEIGGLNEVREEIKRANVDIIACRRQVGVLAFGSDGDIRKAFEGRNISEFDIHAITEKRLRYDSQERGLLYEALARALQRERPVQVKRKSHSYLVAVDISRADDPSYSSLKSVLNPISGTVPGTILPWREAINIRLDYRLGRFWLLIEPTILIDDSVDKSVATAAKEFQRDRLATRYNSTWNAVLDAWLRILIGSQDQREFRAFGISDGIDAVFVLSNKTAFSYKGS